MRPLLFLCPRVPWPLDTGAKIRTSALLKALLESYAVTYAGFLQPDLDEGTAREQLARCEQVHFRPEPAVSAAGKGWLGLRTLADARPATIAKYADARLAAFVREWIAAHPEGLVHADHLHMAGYLAAAAGAGLRVIDEHNVECRIVERLAERTAKRWLAPYYRLQARRMRAWEARMAATADRVLAVSETDALELRRMAPKTPVELIRNGVDLDYFAPPEGGRRPRPGQLVFTGSMNWLPNQDAIQFFVEQVLPVLEREHPREGGWRLDVVGHSPPPAIRALAREGINITGTVDDVRPYVHGAQVYVVPIRIGGGSRLKILEAFAMEIPVVSTAVGCEGLDCEDGVQLRIADEPEQLATAVAELTHDGETAAALAARGRRHAIDHFSWGAIGRRLVEVYEAALAEPIPGGDPMEVSL